MQASPAETHRRLNRQSECTKEGQPKDPAPPSGRSHGGHTVTSADQTECPEDWLRWSRISSVSSSWMCSCDAKCLRFRCPGPVKSYMWSTLTRTSRKAKHQPSRQNRRRWMFHRFSIARARGGGARTQQTAHGKKTNHPNAPGNDTNGKTHATPKDLGKKEHRQAAFGPPDRNSSFGEFGETYFGLKKNKKVAKTCLKWVSEFGKVATPAASGRGSGGCVGPCVPRLVVAVSGVRRLGAAFPCLAVLVWLVLASGSLSKFFLKVRVHASPSSWTKRVTARERRVSPNGEVVEGPSGAFWKVQPASPGRGCAEGLDEALVWHSAVRAMSLPAGRSAHPRVLSAGEPSHSTDTMNGCVSLFIPETHRSHGIFTARQQFLQPPGLRCRLGMFDLSSLLLAPTKG